MHKTHKHDKFLQEPIYIVKCILVLRSQAVAKEFTEVCGLKLILKASERWWIYEINKPITILYTKHATPGTYIQKPEFIIAYHQHLPKLKSMKEKEVKI